MIRFITGAGRRHPVIVLVAWLLVMLAGFTIGNAVFARMTTTVGTVAGSEAQRGAEALDGADLAPPVITAVVSGPSTTDPAFRSEISSTVADLRAIPDVNGVSDPFGPQAPVAADGRAVVLNIELKHRGDLLANRVADRVRDVGDAVDGATVAVSGGPLTDAEFNAQATADTRRAEIISAPILLLLLLIVFGSLIAAGMPLMIAAVGVGGTFAALLGLSLFTDVSIYAIQVTTMLAIGLGVDYALLMVSRYREERATVDDPDEALRRASERAGRTILFSGLTVAVALASLLFFGDPFLRSIGLAGAAVVMIDMLAAITLLPALLHWFGRRIKPIRRVENRGRAFAAVARGVQKVPLLTLLVVVAGLVALALPLIGVRLDTSNPKSLPESSATRQLTEALDEHFPDQGGPSAIAVVATAAPDDSRLTRFADEVADVPGIAGVFQGRTGGGLTVLQAKPEQPTSSAQTARAVERIRALDAPFPVLVTGDAARLVDYKDQLRERLPLAAGVAVLATFLLLLLFTGSLLVPIKAVLTNLLSIGAAFGVVVWVFQQGHLAGLFGASGLDGIDLTVPIVVAAIAFGLSTDYEVFVMSRIRERWLAGAPSDVAVRDGIRRSGGIVTAAALLLVVAFGGFMAGGFAPIKEVGLGLVLAVIIDATIVRMLLVPAIMTLLGRAAWWPGLFGARRQRAAALKRAAAPVSPAEPVGASTGG